MPSKGCATLALGAAVLHVAAADSGAFVATPALRASAAHRAVHAEAEQQRNGAGRIAGGVLAATSLAAAAVTGVSRRGRRADKAASLVSCKAQKTCPEILKGYGGPFPEDFWDPAGLTQNKTDEELLYYRAAEIKHGRVAMVACLGWFHQAAGIHYFGDAAIKSRMPDDPLQALTILPLAAPLQVAFTILCLEWLFAYPLKPEPEEPWDLFGWGVAQWPEDRKNPNQEWKDIRNQELNNGRLAMFGIIGLIAQDLYTGDYAGVISRKPCFVKLFFLPGGGGWGDCPVETPMDLLPKGFTPIITDNPFYPHAPDWMDQFM